MFRICKVEDDEMTGEESLVLVATARSVPELSQFKQKYGKMLHLFVVFDVQNEELEWDDIP